MQAHRTAGSVVICMVFAMTLPLAGQRSDYSWWNQKHQWDGHTPWSRYLILSPSYMGPNALPVPEVKNGRTDGQGSLEWGFAGHFSRGDKTGNLLTKLHLPLFTRRAAVAVSYVPLEVYRTDTLTRDLRRSREFDGEGAALGDVYIATWIQLVEETERLPGILLTVNLKTASGTAFQAARHTDSPGYFFDLSVGRTLHRSGKVLRSLRFYGQAGFYVYQTNRENHMQNDAFLYGAGVDLHMGKFRLTHQIGGYSGYLENGDRPVVYRAELGTDASGRLGARLRFQQGIRDYPYSSLQVSVSHQISRNVRHRSGEFPP